MPTVLRTGPYRMFFFRGDRVELMHVHVERDDNYAKFWLEPVAVATNVGFSAVELNQILRIVREHQAGLKERWREYFNS